MDRCKSCGSIIHSSCDLFHDEDNHNEWLDREEAEGIRPYPEKMEVLIVHPVSYRRNEDLPDGWEEIRKDLTRYSVGERVVHEAGAPGIGRTVYLITRVDAGGVWGTVEEDTVRVLAPWETE